MNKQRRKSLEDIHNQLTDLRELLDEIREEEEFYRDNIPENLQYSERYEAADNAVSNLENAVISLDEALSSIEEAQG